MVDPTARDLTDDEITQCLLDAGVDAAEGEQDGTNRMYWEGWLNQVSRALRVAIAADRARRGRPAAPPAEGEGPTDEELNALWNCSGIADEHGNHTGDIFEFARAALARWGRPAAPPAEGTHGPSIEELSPLIAWLTEASCQAADVGRSKDAGMLCWAAQVVGERVDEDAPDPPAEGEVGDGDDWFTVALVAQDMRSRGLAEQMAGDELLKLANCNRSRRAPVPVSERLPGPEGEGPTVMEILELADQIEAAELGQIDLVRAALARWGRPAAPPAEGKEPMLPLDYIDHERLASLAQNERLALDITLLSQPSAPASVAVPVPEVTP